MSTAAIKRAIRKALEAPLEPALVAGSACLDPSDHSKAVVGFANLPVDPTRAGLVEWCDIVISFAPDRPIEMGKHARTQGAGYALITIRVQSGTGPDRIDSIAGIIAAAYPYDALLARDGVSVIIGTTDTRQGAPDGPWYMVPLLVNWIVYHAE